jgi:hypothetical protein
MNTKRTDEHRPSAIDPSAYTFVGVSYMKIESLGDAYVLQSYREEILAHMNRTGGKYSTHEHGGNCHICGAYCIYTAVFYHAESNSYIRTGFDCASNLDMGDPIRFRAIKKDVKTAREALAGKKKTEALLSDLGLSRVWELSQMESDPTGTASDAWYSLRDVVARICRYGDASEKQLNALRIWADRIDRHAEIEAERKAERDAAAPCPKGKHTVRGLIVSIKDKETMYGLTLKATVKSTEGFLVWGTLPKAVIMANVGDEIEFSATIEPSERDPKFGFFRRPTKARLV